MCSRTYYWTQHLILKLPTFIHTKYLHCSWHLSASAECLIQSHPPVLVSCSHHSCSCQRQEPNPEPAWPLGHFLMSVKQDKEQSLSYTQLKYLKLVEDIHIILTILSQIQISSLLIISYIWRGMSPNWTLSVAAAATSIQACFCKLKDTNLGHSYDLMIRKTNKAVIWQLLQSDIIAFILTGPTFGVLQMCAITYGKPKQLQRFISKFIVIPEKFVFPSSKTQSLTWICTSLPLKMCL